MKFVVNWLACVAAVFLMSNILPDRVSYNGYVGLLAAGTLIWLIYIVVRPILRIISLPITILTLGLFSLILNTLMVMLADSLLVTVSFGGFWPSFLIALLVSIFQMVLNSIFKS